MGFRIALDHVAVLVPSVREAAEHLSQLGFRIGKEEEWDGEGTREIYVEKGRSNSLLLMEPIKPGPYRRAMDKRGPGIHHLAIDVVDLWGYVESLAGSGWLLHPQSLRTMKNANTAYLARPGFPALIEVQGKGELSEGTPFVSRVALDFNSSLQGLLPWVGLDTIVIPSTSAELSMDGRTIRLW